MEFGSSHCGSAAVFGVACGQSYHRATHFPNPFICLPHMNSQFSFNLINFKTPDPAFPPISPKNVWTHFTDPNQFPTSIPAQTPALHIFATLLNTRYEPVPTYFDHFQSPRPTVSPNFTHKFLHPFHRGIIPPHNPHNPLISTIPLIYNTHKNFIFMYINKQTACSY